MTTIDQCPSTTHGEKKRPAKAELAGMAARAGTIRGERAWRSLDEVADTAEFRDFLEREFPAGASEFSREDEGEKPGESRRTFLKLMGASVALAGAATVPGCRQPDHKIMPYSREVPEEIIPGKPLYYATSFARPDGGAEGLLVETHEGRPTKIEGNPLHPVSQGKPSVWAMASIMGLYDPDRLKQPVYLNPNPERGRVDATWDDFRTWTSSGAWSEIEANGGRGLAVLADKKSSPSRQAAIAAYRAKFPNARWFAYAPAESTACAEATRMCFGAPMREVLKMTRAGTRVVVSLDRDFLHKDANEVSNARQFAATRLVMKPSDTMSRLYCIESGFSLTGAQADHRLRQAPSGVTAFAVALAKYILPKASAPGTQGISSALDGMSVQASRFVEECAKDLLDADNRGKSLILAGESQPAEVHALVIAMNAALSNLGQSVAYLPMTDEEASPSLANLRELTDNINSGAVTSLVCINTNPLYDAPAALQFDAAFKKLRATVTLSVESTETAAASTWSLNEAHYLESWGDTQAHDGTIAPVQPMIAPLYEPAMSDLEFITFLTNRGAERVDGYAAVREMWRKFVTGDFEKKWRGVLHDGVVAETSQSPQAPSVRFDEVANGLKRLPAAPTGLEVVFCVGNVGDGRYANVGWLQELPESGAKTVWDNPILMSPKTAADLRLLPEYYNDKDPNAIYYKPRFPEGKLATVTIGGQSVTGVAWILPGMADNTLLLTLGYGRESAGLVGDGVGFNMYRVRPLNAVNGRFVAGATAERAEGTHMVASTQNHWSMEGRGSIVRAVDLPRYQKFGDVTAKAKHELYGTEDTLNFAEQMGELAHTPPTISIYDNPYNKSQQQPRQDSAYAKGPQWAMTIDQTTCTGCGACTIACQSENNIAVVGKKEVAKGREMAWIRVDRYYTGDDINDPTAMYHQPVACVHCENAPCETVCPVNATVHGPEGINYMTYNRCIGTRYCANNCPYKVRRFNFFDYGVTKFNGSYYGKGILDPVGKVVPGQGTGITGSGEHNSLNPNLIPPRLRQKLDEITRMQKNPDVTVRSRGVMEKCSYCVQRINAARIECKVGGLPGVPDGYFQPACQQACPTEAITFGDMLLPNSAVARTKANARSYALLGYLDTRPRTSHMVRVVNPKRELCTAERVAEWDQPLTHEEPEEGGPEDAAHTQLFDFKPSRRSEDRGYALSLRVLGMQGGRA